MTLSQSKHRSLGKKLSKVEVSIEACNSLMSRTKRGVHRARTHYMQCTHHLLESFRVSKAMMHHEICIPLLSEKNVYAATLLLMHKLSQQITV